MRESGKRGLYLGGDMNKKLLCLLVVTVLLFPGIVLAQTGSGEYQKNILDNGASVVCKYLPESPVVVVQIRVLSGLSNEGEYAGTGISHFLEHLLFKGTHDKTSEEIFEEIRGMGGTINAFTGMDSAAYHLTVPNDKLEEAIELLTDMVMDPVFTDEDLEKEREVVLKEINMHADNPGYKLSRQLYARSFRDNVYKYPIIGYKEKFVRLTREDIVSYHKSAYTAERIIMGIAGGVIPGKAISLASKKLAEYERGETWTPALKTEPMQLGEREATSYMDINLGYLSIGFHSTSLFSEDLYSTDILAGILGKGAGSRLYKRLVKEKELLYSVSCVNMTPKYPGLFIISGKGEPENLEEARSEIFAVINEIIDEGVTAEEIERIKSMISASLLRSKEQVYKTAFSITSSEMLIGEPNFDTLYIEGVSGVREEDVVEVAENYLKIQNSTTSILLPEGGTDNAIIQLSQENISADEEKVTVLDNGLKLIVKKRSRLPLVSVSAVFPGGTKSETKDNNGVSNLASNLLFKGTTTRSEDDILPYFEKMGAHLRASSGKHSFHLSMDLLAEDLNRGLDVFFDVIRDPVFPEKELQKAKRKVFASLGSQKKNMTTEGNFRMKKLIYGDHPYAMKNSGTKESVKAITREDIVAFYKERFLPEGAILTVAGDVDIEAVIRDISSKVSGWKGEARANKGKDINAIHGVLREEFTMDKEQALVLIAYSGVDVFDERKYTLSVISSMLSGGGGILFTTIREDMALAYTCGAGSSSQEDGGMFMIIVKTSEEQIAEVEKAVLDVVETVRDGEISEAFLESTKNKMITGYATGIETNSSIAKMMALGEYTGLGYEYYKDFPGKVKKVSLDDVTECAVDILDPDNRAVVIVHSNK